LKRLIPMLPPIVMKLQAQLRECDISGLDPTSNRCCEVIVSMSSAASRVSEAKPIKNPNPMLGSKVLAFFFPDFFPVWDTAWIKQRGLSRQPSGPFPPAIGKELKADPAALEYAGYLWLMINDAWMMCDEDYERLHSACIVECRRQGYQKPREVLDEFYSDLTP